MCIKHIKALKSISFASLLQEFIQIFHMEGNMTLDTAEKFVEKLQYQGHS